VLRDVLRQQFEQPVGEVHDALTSVLGRPNLDGADTCALDLPSDIEGSAQEIDVADLQSGGFAKPESGERCQGDEGAEGGVGDGHDRAHLLRRRQGHGCLPTAITRQRHAVARVDRDHPVSDRGTQDRTDVVDPRLDRARRQAIGVHALDPGLDVGSPQLREGKPPELGAPHGQAHRCAGVGLPQLTCRPLGVEVVQGDPAGLRVQVRAAHLVGLHGGQEALGVQLSGERLRSLTTRRVEVPGAPAVPPAVPVGPGLVASDRLLPAVFNVRHAMAPWCRLGGQDRNPFSRQSHDDLVGL
jgi:hypothetical protein